MVRTVPIAGVDLHVEVRGEGAAPPLLLVHGFPLDHTMWREQIEYFSRTRRVIAPDLRGFGQSHFSATKWTMRQHADDLEALLDALEETRPVVFCGLSMGGYIAWQFVEHHRERLAGLIVCDSLATPDPPENAATRLASADRLEREQGNGFLVEAMLPRLFGAELAASGKEIVVGTKQVMLATSPATCAAAQRGMAERVDYSPRLSTIDLPTLILCGQHDIISPPEKMRAIAQAIPAANYVEIAGASHMAPLEMPDAVNQAIEIFLASLK